MINPLSIAGAILLAIGAILVLLGIGGMVRGLVRRLRFHRKPVYVEGGGVWSGAVTSRQVYVPGSIGRGFGKIVLGLVLVALSLPPLWAGVTLAREWVRVDEPVQLGSLRAAGPGRIRLDPIQGESAEGPLPGRIYVANTEVLEFGGPLARVGLGRYARLSHVSSFQGPAEVLGHHGLARVEVPRSRTLLLWIERLHRYQPTWVTVSRRLSGPIDAGRGEAAIWATPDGVEWR